MKINNFTVVESIYGKIIVNRHCDFQIDALAKTGKTHIESELANIFTYIDKLPVGSIVIDAGANIGLFSIPVAQRRKNLAIMAFEPQRMLFNALCGSIALNDIENIHAFNEAISERCETLAVPDIDYSKKMDFGMVKVNKPNLDSETDEWNVCAITIDSLELDNLSFIKIDVEGYEIEAIKGAKKTIEACKPILWVEHHIVGVQAIVEAVGPGYRFEVKDPLNMVCEPI